MTTEQINLLQNLNDLSAPQLRRLLTEHLTQQKLGLYWESSAVERDVALNANIVLPRLCEGDSHGLAALAGPGTPNLIIEGDNFDSLRLLKSTHAGKVRVIYIDQHYNTGNKDWVYNDRYVGANDRWRHSQWLEFLYRRLTLAKDLLTQDGVIMVSINDEDRSRLELLMDDVFPGRRLGTISRPGDTVLDFFAGGGTTGHAVLALNALDLAQNADALPSRKNIYGVMFPDTDSVAMAASAVPLESQKYLKNEAYLFEQDTSGKPTGDVFSTARLDATYEFNTQELAFAKALDRADFVAWWHRNPQGKPYSIALMRTDSRNMFYPDFVVCLQHELDDEPLIRLVETKHDVKDANRKGKHQSKTYGRVLFLTKDAQRFKIVQDNGSLGEVVDFDDLTRLRQWMRDSTPAISH